MISIDVHDIEPLVLQVVVYYYTVQWLTLETFKILVGTNFRCSLQLLLVTKKLLHALQ